MVSSAVSLQTTALDLSPNYPYVTLLPRLNEQRSNGNYGWLKTFHTFSSDSYDTPTPEVSLTY